MTSPRKIEFFLPESRYTGREKGFKGTQWVPTNRNAFSGGVLFKKCVCLISPFQELCNKICSPTFTQWSHERASAEQGSLEKGTQREVQRVSGQFEVIAFIFLFCFCFETDWPGTYRSLPPKLAEELCCGRALANVHIFFKAAAISHNVLSNWRSEYTTPLCRKHTMNFNMSIWGLERLLSG